MPVRARTAGTGMQTIYYHSFSWTSRWDASFMSTCKGRKQKGAAALYCTAVASAMRDARNVTTEPFLMAVLKDFRKRWIGKGSWLCVCVWMADVSSVVGTIIVQIFFIALQVAFLHRDLIVRNIIFRTMQVYNNIITARTLHHVSQRHLCHCMRIRLIYCERKGTKRRLSQRWYFCEREKRRNDIKTTQSMFA